MSTRKPLEPPKKRTYKHKSQNELELAQALAKYGDELMRRCGFKVPITKLGLGFPAQVPIWMDPITRMWLDRGSEIPWAAFQDVIKAGMAGRMEEVEMFLFTWDAS